MVISYRSMRILGSALVGLLLLAVCLWMVAGRNATDAASAIQQMKILENDSRLRYV